MLNLEDLQIIRLANTRQLAEEVGGRSVLAKKLGVAYGHLSNYIGRTPSQVIGEKFARRVEEITGKPYGWLDLDRDVVNPLQDVSADKKLPRIDDDAAIANRVRSMMSKHGVKKHKQISTLSAILEITTSPAKRKMIGQAPWSLVQLQAIADYFNEPADVLLLPERESNAMHKETQTTAAVPAIVPGEKAATSLAGTSKCVAVLDDDPNITESVCDYLHAVGFKASPYFTTESLLKEQKDFDAYIVDWLVGQTTTRPVLAKIRARNPDCQLIVLTGKSRMKETNADELATAVEAYDAQFYEKPAQISFIVSRLKERWRKLNQQVIGKSLR